MVALKLSEKPEREIGNMLRTIDCDKKKVNYLIMKRPVEAQEITLDEFPNADLIMEKHWGSKGVVTALQETTPHRTPNCVCDYFAGETMRAYFEAVAELHDNSSLDAHCDVKFSNFVRPSGGSITDRCLIDLELAISRSRGNFKTGKRGTPIYMAPEVFLYGEVNRMVDSWSLGIMLYQACHRGRMHPFTDNSSLTTSSLTAMLSGRAYEKCMWTNTGSPLAADLTAMLLNHDIYARLTPTEALSHPLFAPFAFERKFYTNHQ